MNSRNGGARRALLCAAIPVALFAGSGCGGRKSPPQASPAPPALVRITVTLSGNGGGRVESKDGLLACPGTCSVSVASGSSLVLLAHADGGSNFDGYAGACNGGPDCTLSPLAASGVVAALSAKPPLPPPPAPPPPLRTVTVAVAGSGTVTSNPPGIACPGTCSASFPAGSALVFSQLPSDRMVFSHWAGACDGTGKCQVTIARSDVQLQASFRAMFSPGFVQSPPSRRTCRVTVPETPSATWPGWSEIASFETAQIAHAVDASGAIHIAESKDGVVVHREHGSAWDHSPPLPRDGISASFALDGQARAFVSNVPGRRF